MTDDFYRNVLEDVLKAVAKELTKANRYHNGGLKRACEAKLQSPFVRLACIHFGYDYEELCGNLRFQAEAEARQLIGGKSCGWILQGEDEPA